MPRYEISVSITEIDDDNEIVSEDTRDFSFHIESDNPQRDIVEAVSKENPSFSGLCT